MSNKLTSYLESQMQALKLKGMLTHYQELTEKASQNNLSYAEYLSLLFEEELKRKNDGTVKTKINKARFPFIKTLEEFDFGFQPSLREKEIIALSSLEKKEPFWFRLCRVRDLNRVYNSKLFNMTGNIYRLKHRKTILCG